jgi:hypothetical protein
MNWHLLVTIAGALTALGALISVVFGWVRSRSADKIVIRRGDDIQQLDANDPRDVKAIIDIVGKLAAEPKVTVPQPHLHRRTASPS